MKKYVMLIAFTAIVLLGVYSTGNLYKGSIIEVSTVKVDPVTAKNSILCTGKVERAQVRSVYAQSAAVVKEIFVKTGDDVKKGEVLMTLDDVTEETEKDQEELQEAYQSLLEAYQSGDTSALDSLALPAAASAAARTPKTRKIVAPISGTVTSISVNTQGYVDPNKAVMVISNNNDLQIRLSVNESQISEIKTGQKAEITGVGFKGSTFEGTVTSISNEAKQLVSAYGQETVVEVLVSVKDPTEAIKPGFTAKTKIITSEDENVLVAPYEAVRADNNGNEFVYKLDGQKAVKTPILTKEEFEDGLEIVSGLKKDDVIITNPDAVTAGARVVPAEEGETQ